ncbi:GbsR/MarR family transcriptional regulator [Parapedobacter koreensis]|uniref:HTH-type transcriptional regulator n=1 Tax=Parapedobacter koreensis TaxID=332977 RepID=A0A1H7U7A4_9SPHI|nr:ArsR family transcriptional regulator [Parapedobacter koreensis]SEL92679.1 DNA-binding transcriptional regulator GbsR, MarR family [Parapedobacter koreensis]
MDLQASKQQFIDTWGALGTEWGINKSVAQVQALLLASTNPLSTDEIMDMLKISRGNANMSLRQLVDYGIIYKKVIAGDRKEYFVAEKDIFKWAMKIASMRKQREIDPVMGVLADIRKATEADRSDDGKDFYEVVSGIQSFVDQLSKIADKLIQSNRSELLLKLLKALI